MSHEKVRITIATRNVHKTREFATLLAADFDVYDLSRETDLPVIEETGSTFEENANLKALAIARILPGYILADDSGLEVDALGGAPGVFSARYAGRGATDSDNVKKLLSSLAETHATTGGAVARFRCVLSLAASARLLGSVAGEVNGRIVTGRRGSHGFGYDPVFVPDGYEQTFAELSETTKNQISHRAQAVARLREAWRQLAQPSVTECP